MDYGALFEELKRDWENPGQVASVHSREKWEKAAPKWEKELAEDPYTISLTGRRISECVSFLRSHGALEEGFRTMDIGCGPGRFTAAFARYAALSEGTDFSSGMISLGEKFCRQEGIANTKFTLFDFMRDDPASQGWEGAFDLVFASMAPAIKSYDSFCKMNAMSRAFCCNCSCVSEESLSGRVIAEALGRDRVGKVWSGRGFFTMENMLRLRGYLPVTTYFKTETDDAFAPDLQEVNFSLRKMLRDDLRPEDTQRAYDALMANSSGGVFPDHKSGVYGIMLWDVRDNYMIF